MIYRKFKETFCQNWSSSGLKRGHISIHPTEEDGDMEGCVCCATLLENEKASLESS